MEIQDSFNALLQKTEPNIKAGIDQIRYDLARKNLTKSPTGAEFFLEQSTDLLSNEIFKTLNEIKGDIYKPKEWERVRYTLKQFIEVQSTLFFNFLVGNWEQPASQINSQLNVLKSSILKETDSYIDRQKIKLSKGGQVSRDLIKICYYGLAAGIVGFLLKFFLSR